MTTKKATGREYRVLVIAVMFFAAGLFFFIKDTASPPPSGAPSPSAPTFNVAPAGPAALPSPLFAKYPDPSKFQKFIYDGRTINNGNELAVSATCDDVYLAILVYPADFDYRQDPNRAVFNKAFPCTITRPFSYVISTADATAFKPGTYYVIKADQGARGTWYDPR